MPKFNWPILYDTDLPDLSGMTPKQIYKLCWSLARYVSHRNNPYVVYRVYCDQASISPTISNGAYDAFVYSADIDSVGQKYRFYASFHMTPKIKHESHRLYCRWSFHNEDTPHPLSKGAALLQDQ